MYKNIESNIETPRLLRHCKNSSYSICASFFEISSFFTQIYPRIRHNRQIDQKRSFEPFSMMSMHAVSYFLNRFREVFKTFQTVRHLLLSSNASDLRWPIMLLQYWEKLKMQRLHGFLFADLRLAKTRTYAEELFIRQK